MNILELSKKVKALILNFLHVICLFRASREYWETLKPASGRPYSSACSQPACWGITAGDSELKQKTAATTEEEIKKLQNKK